MHSFSGYLVNEQDLGGMFRQALLLTTYADVNRGMPAIQGQSWASRGEQNLSLLTTSPKTKVSVLGSGGRRLLLIRAPGEKARISAAGGFVDFGRVNGNLALSRAIGDFEFKKSADLSPEQQIVTANPDVTTHELSADDEFLVIACDGIACFQSLFVGPTANATFL